eukprot:6214794-Pleurochrysis_carterae.AAC.1
MRAAWLRLQMHDCVCLDRHKNELARPCTYAQKILISSIPNHLVPSSASRPTSPAIAYAKKSEQKAAPSLQASDLVVCLRRNCQYSTCETRKHTLGYWSTGLLRPVYSETVRAHMQIRYGKRRNLGHSEGRRRSLGAIRGAGPE